MHAPFTSGTALPGHDLMEGVVLPNPGLLQSPSLGAGLLLPEDHILGRVRWLMSIIPALWEAEVRGSPEVRSSRPA